MKIKYFSTVALAIFIVAVLFSGVQPVTPASFASVAPGSGWWEVDWWDWDRHDTVTYIPQHQLAPTVNPNDYALLHTNGIEISGPAKICHTYPGINVGWTPEFRYQTSSGWVPVGTFYDYNEGYFLVCSQAWAKGVYALFGYWEKPQEDFQYFDAVIY